MPNQLSEEDFQHKIIQEPDLDDLNSNKIDETSGSVIVPQFAKKNDGSSNIADKPS